jgi:hypothetical protein
MHRHPTRRRHMEDATVIVGGGACPTVLTFSPAAGTQFSPTELDTPLVITCDNAVGVVIGWEVWSAEIGGELLDSGSGASPQSVSLPVGEDVFVVATVSREGCPTLTATGWFHYSPNCPVSVSADPVGGLTAGGPAIIYSKSFPTQLNPYITISVSPAGGGSTIHWRVEIDAATVVSGSGTTDADGLLVLDARSWGLSLTEGPTAVFTSGPFKLWASVSKPGCSEVEEVSLGYYEMIVGDAFYITFDPEGVLFEEVNGGMGTTHVVDMLAWFEGAPLSLTPEGEGYAAHDPDYPDYRIRFTILFTDLVSPGSHTVFETDIYGGFSDPFQFARKSAFVGSGLPSGWAYIIYADLVVCATSGLGGIDYGDHIEQIIATKTSGYYRA